jgi:hypothetical protein
MRGSLSPLPATNRWDISLTVGVGPRVAKTMKGVKDLASERRGYEWPRLRSGCVTIKDGVRPGNGHAFQPKRRTILQDVLQLRILVLGTRKGLVIEVS